MNVMKFHINGNPNDVLEFEVKTVVNAGYTGRDQAAVQAHIDELKEKGIPAPEETPVYFPVFQEGVLQKETFDVLHEDDNTGEAEYALIYAGGEIFVAAGNDHTDRKLEEVDIPKAKQVYPNFISKDVWRLADVKDHWDKIVIRSWIRQDGKKVLFQEGNLSALMGPDELMKRMDDVIDIESTDGLMVFSGTIASIFGIDYSPYFEVELDDTVTGKKLGLFTEFKPITSWFKKKV
jgi:hypothetical protein